MFGLVTLAAGLAACVLFAEFWLRGKRPRVVRLCIAVAAGAAVFAALWVFWQAGAFLTAMLCGQAACLVYDLARRDRQLLLPELCLYLGCDAVWLPLGLCGGGVWGYAVYMAVLLLCIALTFISQDCPWNRAHKLIEFYPERRKQYWAVSCLPCVVLVPAGLVMAVIRRPSVVSALVLSAVFLLLFALAVCMQREVICRLNAEYLNHTMVRWQQESRDYMNTIRSQRHDYNLHLHAVSGLINSGKYAECQEYVQKLVSQANDVNDIMPVCDPVVGSMLYNMREKARKQGTDILYHITYDMEDILCNGFECNKIIGNLLQNAIDALQTPEDKAYGIRLKILKRRGNTVIISENRFTGDPDSIARVFEPGYSTKQGHEGIGLSMVLRTAQRYGGRVYPEFEPDIIRFIVNIPNKVNLQKGIEDL